MAKRKKNIDKAKFAKAMDGLPPEEIRRLVADDSGVVLPLDAEPKELIELAYRATSEEATPEAPAPSDERKFVVRVMGQPHRFRGGRRWTQVSTIVRESELTPEQWEQVRGDRVIEVIEVK